MSKCQERFLKAHADADEVVMCTKTGKVMGALYYAPDYDDHDKVRDHHLKRFFMAVEAKRY